MDPDTVFRLLEALGQRARGSDVRAMLDRELLTRDELRDAFEGIRSRLIRFPRLDAERLAEALTWACDEGGAA